MIPKKIHYIWFGGREEPSEVERFKSTWRSAMPDWEIVRWDESNFDVHSNVYCSQAYQARKWAFASDYARLKVLYDNGGIYLDTDEEAIRSLSPFLHHKAFFGMEPGNLLQAGVIGSEKGSECIAKILDYYEDLQFKDADGSYNQYVIGSHMAKVLSKEYGFVLKEEIQCLEDSIVVYPSSYFCPDLATLKVTENTYSIHRPMGSWLSPTAKLKKNVYQFITRQAPLRWLYHRFYRLNKK